MNKTVDEILAILKDYVEVACKGNQTAAAKKLGIKAITLRQWLLGTRKPKLTSIEPILPYLGISIENGQYEPGKDICFVNAKMSDAGENLMPPEAEDYIAAPLVGEAGAGPGYLPENEVKSWFLVYKNLPAIRYRRNLIAVEIAKKSTSMQPTLNPGDIVLVDRDDRDVTNPGHIMLVLDPLDGSGMIKRVSVREEKNTILLTYYSDNAASFPPLVYDLNADFYGDWDKAIVGRVIWAWSDMREK